MSRGGGWGRKWGGRNQQDARGNAQERNERAAAIASAAAARSDLQMKRAREQDDIAVTAQCHRDTTRVLAQLEGFAE